MELLYIVGILLALALLVRGGLWLRDYRRRLRIRLEPVPPGADAPEGFSELGKVRVRPRLDQAGSVDDSEPELGPVIVVSPRLRADDEGARVAAVPAAALRGSRAGEGAALQPQPAAAPVGDAAVQDGAALHAAAKAPTTALPTGQSHAEASRPAVDARAGLLPALDQEALPDSAAAPVPGTSAPSMSAPAAAVSKAAVDATVPATSIDQGGAAGSIPLLVTPVTTPLPDAVQQDMFANDMIAPPPMPDRTRNRAAALYGAPAVEPVRPLRPPETKPVVEVQDVIALHVVAREHPFNGEDLLRCILGYGLRFGDMSIFHRHERPTGQGEVLFSMASAVEPGTFDLQAMSGQEIIGVSFFQSLPGVNSIHAYDIMVDTAKRLSIELQGELLDQQQQPLTRQLVEHYRERVQEFERRRLMQRPAR